MRRTGTLVGTVGQQMDGWQAHCNCGWRHRGLRTAKRASALLRQHMDDAHFPSTTPAEEQQG